MACKGVLDGLRGRSGKRGLVQCRLSLSVNSGEFSQVSASQFLAGFWGGLAHLATCSKLKEWLAGVVSA